MRTWRVGWMMMAAVALLLPTAPAIAQDHGGGGGGGGGCGDVFGDLIHIVRDEVTGQPILARRFVELPKEVPGYGWGYCAMALDATGGVIPFVPYSCDLDLDPDGDGVEDYEVVEVDYFGRLSGGRTKEKNHRMHLDEVISTIKMAEAVHQEPVTGRLMMGFDCAFNGGGNLMTCAEWNVVDSPMESMALYTRLMKYGHLQTDPEELDIWAHGDPKGVPPFHPALDPSDWAKFQQSVRHLLPGRGEALCYTDDYPAGSNGLYDAPEAFVDEPDADGEYNGTYDPGERFADVNENGTRDPGDSFDTSCAAPESLTAEDFIRAGTYLGAAANKFGFITRDLTQYMNRILKITQDTHTTASTKDTLPARVLDCEDPNVFYAAPDENDPNPQDPAYLALEDCLVYDAFDEYGVPDPLLEDTYVHFPDVQELFVDFGALSEGEGYIREDWRNEAFPELILPLETEDTPELVPRRECRGSRLAAERQRPRPVLREHRCLRGRRRRCGAHHRVHPQLRRAGVPALRGSRRVATGLPPCGATGRLRAACRCYRESRDVRSLGGPGPSAPSAGGRGCAPRCPGGRPTRLASRGSGR